MPRTEQANQRIRDEQRTKILDAARKVFAEKGNAATMDDIAAEASVSHGLAYRYFASKEAILRALIEQAIQQSPKLERANMTTGTPGQQLGAMLTNFVESRREQPQFFRLLNQVLHDETMPEEFRKVVHARGKALQKTLRELIVEGQATGEVANDDPDQLVMAISACMDGLTFAAARDPQKFAEHFPDVAIFLRMLKPSNVSTKREKRK